MKYMYKLQKKNELETLTSKHVNNQHWFSICVHIVKNPTINLLSNESIYTGDISKCYSIVFIFFIINLLLS